MPRTKMTTDHETIRKWAEARGGRPAQVRGTDIIRIDFPGFSGEESLEEISWEEFFKKFDESNLAFLYQDQKNSRFNKLVKRTGAGTKRMSQRKRQGKSKKAAARPRQSKREARPQQRTQATGQGDSPVGAEAENLLPLERSVRLNRTVFFRFFKSVLGTSQIV